MFVDLELWKGTPKTIREGSDLDLDCQAEGVNRDITYRWLYRGAYSPDTDLTGYNVIIDNSL